MRSRSFITFFDKPSIARKLQRYGIVEKRVFPEVPPRVEYRLTAFGKKFAKVLDGIERLQGELDGPGA